MLASSLDVIAALATAAVALHALHSAYRSWRGYRGGRVVSCPETGAPAVIQLARGLAAASAPFGRPWLRVRACTRWPAARGCPQRCLAPIRRDADAGIARLLVARWSAGRRCVLCGSPLEMPHGSFEPALLREDGASAGWRELPLEMLRERLRVDRPLCWHCHVVRAFHRERPDLFGAPAR